jgi:hypothetical protein
MKWQKFSKLSSLGLFLLFTITACRLSSANQPITLDATAPLSKLEENFVQQIVGEAVINSELQIEQQLQEDIPKEILHFHIYNYSDEPITFDNQIFEARGFCADSQKRSWRLYTIPLLETNLSSASVTITLPPNLKVFDYEIDNSLTIFRNTLIASGCDEIRLYIGGNGEVTNTIYGAYVDINLLP